MSDDKCSVAFVIPSGWTGLAAHHEATSGMGALAAGAAPFLYPPQTVAVCAAEARRAGIETAFVPAEAILEGHRTKDFDVLAILVSHGTHLADAHLLRQLSSLCAAESPTPTPVLVFGASAHLVAHPWIEEGLAHTALLGEPEGAIAEAIQRTAHGELAGVVLARDLAPGRYRTEYHLADLDTLPYPAWDIASWKPYGAASILTSRGCPSGCAYCAYTVPGGTVFRAQSPERVVDEIAWLAQTEAPPRVQVRDPVFAHEPGRAMAICEQLMRRGVRQSFACESRPEHFDDELLRALHAAGCSTVKIGLESADPELLVRIGRAADAERTQASISAAIRVSRTCARLGIGCQLFVMIGLPSQDSASLHRTESVLRTLPDVTQIRTKPYESHPGTPMIWPSAPASPETVAWLEGANRGSAAPWRRAVRRLARALHANSAPRQPAALQAPVEMTDPSVSEPAAIERAALCGKIVFLTGGNGFIGGYVARSLAAAGCRVRALVRPGSDLGSLAKLMAVGASLEIVRGDLAAGGPWLHALEGCEFCLHLAGAYGGSDRADEMMLTNATGTDLLCAGCAAAGVRRLVHVSTIGTVGRPETAGLLPDETTPFNLWASASPYVRSKYLGERMALDWSRRGLEVVVVHPAAPVGAGDARPTATGRRIVAALRGEPFAYPVDGVNHAPVQDIAHGILLAAAAGVSGRTYILGHMSGNLSRDQFTELVRAGLPEARSSRERSGGGALPAGLTANPARAVRELGMPQSDLNAAFAEAVRWYRENGYAASDAA